MSKNSKSEIDCKPEKPYPDFPLFAHATRRWAKKIRQKTHYFGSWDDPQAAVDLYNAQRDDLYAGRKPREIRDGFTVQMLVNSFLTAKQQKVDNGELSSRTFQDYHATCARIVEEFGRTRLVEDISIDDFRDFRAKLAKGRGYVSLGNEINRVRVVFRHASADRHIPHRIEFGSGFSKPEKKVVEKERQAKGERRFESWDLRRILRNCSPQIKAMVLLGINCAFGNTDVAELPVKALDLAGGWVNFPRPKTAVKRRCQLWPETIEALEAVLAERPETTDEAVFITRTGQRWVRPAKNGKVWIDSLACEISKLLIKLNLKRPGLNFYALRHTFQTEGNNCPDAKAVSAIMGHSARSDDMSSRYTEHLPEDKRLRAVAAHMRRWLFESFTDPERELLQAAAKRLTVKADTAGVTRVSAGRKVLGGDDDTAVYVEALADLRWRGLVEEADGVLRRTEKGDAVLAKAEAEAAEEE